MNLKELWSETERDTKAVLPDGFRANLRGGFVVIIRTFSAKPICFKINQLGGAQVDNLQTLAQWHEDYGI
jgi:hypothetical protein